MGRSLGCVSMWRAAIDERARGFNLHGHIGQQEAQSLEGANRRVKLLTGAGVLERQVESSLRDAYGLSAHAGTGNVERAHGSDEARAFAAPDNFSTGTRQSWKISSHVAEARIPSLSSFLPKLNPGAPFSTTMHEAPRGPLAGFVRAITE